MICKSQLNPCMSTLSTSIRYVGGTHPFSTSLPVPLQTQPMWQRTRKSRLIEESIQIIGPLHFSCVVCACEKSWYFEQLLTVCSKFLTNQLLVLLLMCLGAHYAVLSFWMCLAVESHTIGGNASSCLRETGPESQFSRRRSALCWHWLDAKDGKPLKSNPSSCTCLF